MQLSSEEKSIRLISLSIGKESDTCAPKDFLNTSLSLLSFIVCSALFCLLLKTFLKNDMFVCFWATHTPALLTYLLHTTSTARWYVCVWVLVSEQSLLPSVRNALHNYYFIHQHFYINFTDRYSTELRFCISHENAKLIKVESFSCS